VQATYGDDALAKMLAAFADGLGTPQAIERCFEIEQAEFEKGYLAYLQRVLADAPATAAETSEKTDAAALLQQVADDARNPDLLAKLALAHWEEKNYAEARQRAEQALGLKPEHQLAGYVRARVHLLVGENEEAASLLEKCLDHKSPDARALRLLAGLKVQAKDFDAARSLYELGEKTDPQNPAWQRALAALYLRQGVKEKLRSVLARLAETEADEFLVPKKLAQLALEGQDHAAAVKWANRALHVNVLDSEVHEMLAQALVGQKDWPPAIEEYEVLVKMKPGRADLRMSLARACLEAQRPDDARKALMELLETEPDHAEARQLLETLP
jgi:predicted Zn-dependent protease